MNCMEFLQTNIFATLLTVLVTVGTSVISEIHGHHKMKIENFDKIFACIEGLNKSRAEILDKCNKELRSIGEEIPEREKWEGMSGAKQLKKYDNTYQRLNDIISEYSKFLEFFLSFSHYLYKNKPLIPIIRADCWSLLNIYEQVVQKGHEQGYVIKFSQIASLVQFIRLMGKRAEKKEIKNYLKRNHVAELM